jgi:hypothetical protein
MPGPAISAIFCAPWRRQNQFKGWSLISLEENLIKIGRASGHGHGKYSKRFLRLIAKLHPQPETEYSRQFGIHLGEPG